MSQIHQIFYVDKLSGQSDPVPINVAVTTQTPVRTLIAYIINRDYADSIALDDVLVSRMEAVEVDTADSYSSDTLLASLLPATTSDPLYIHRRPVAARRTVRTA